MPTLKEQVGEKVRLIRKQKGLSQAKLAEKVGLSVNMIGCIERGEKFASATTFQKLTEALGAPALEFFCFEPQSAAEHAEKLMLFGQLNKLLSDTPTEMIKLITKLVMDSVKFRNKQLAGGQKVA